MKKKTAGFLLIAILAFTLITSFSGVALAGPAPYLSSVKMYSIQSKSSSTGTPRSETFPTNVVAPSTSLQHYKFDVQITITQMGYDKGYTATLGGVNPSSESYVYLNA